jgi:hypothetical protein
LAAGRFPGFIPVISARGKVDTETWLLTAILRVDNCDSQSCCHVLQGPIRSDDVIHETLGSKIKRYRQLNSIKRPEAMIISELPDEPFRLCKMTISHCVGFDAAREKVPPEHGPLDHAPLPG